VVDIDNNPSERDDGYGWKPADGYGGWISHDYRGEHPKQK
jgi:hypothetical protein